MYMCWFIGNIFAMTILPSPLPPNPPSPHPCQQPQSFKARSYSMRQPSSTRRHQDYERSGQRNPDIVVNGRRWGNVQTYLYMYLYSLYTYTLYMYNIMQNTCKCRYLCDINTCIDVHWHQLKALVLAGHCSTESSDSMGGGQPASHAGTSVDDTGHKLGLALNPNRAEMPGKRKGSYDQVHVMCRLAGTGHADTGVVSYIHVYACNHVYTYTV